MENNKTDSSVETEQTTASSAKKTPLKVIKVENVSASIFDFPNPDGQTNYSVSFSRSYVDSFGKRQYVKFFNQDDLEKVATAAKQSVDFIRDRSKA